MAQRQKITPLLQPSALLQNVTGPLEQPASNNDSNFISTGIQALGIQRSSLPVQAVFTLSYGFSMANLLWTNFKNLIGLSSQ